MEAGLRIPETRPGVSFRSIFSPGTRGIWAAKWCIKGLIGSWLTRLKPFKNIACWDTIQKKAKSFVAGSGQGEKREESLKNCFRDDRAFGDLYTIYKTGN